MKRSLVGLSLALAALPLTACVDDGYGYGGVRVGHGYVYDGYYDGYYNGYYGPIYDGYWGNNGYFYYRRDQSERRYRRGDRDHFRRSGEHPGGNFRPMQGKTRPPEGARMPHLDRGGRTGGGGAPPPR